MKRSSHYILRSRSDLILWDTYVDEPELLRDLHIGNDADAVINIIHNNWDSFCKRGVSRPMFDFEFCINTGNSPPVCCQQPVYSFHESKIIKKTVADLEASDLITDCEGARGSLLLLAAKHHQESCTNIHDFI